MTIRDRSKKSKGQGWHGEPGRHRAAALGEKTVKTAVGMSPSTRPDRSIEGHVVVTVLDRPSAVSVRWAESLRDATGPSQDSQVARQSVIKGRRMITGDNQFLMPDGLPIDKYAVLEEDNDFVFLAVLLSNDHVSAKHRYLVTRRDWERAGKKSGGKSF